MCMLLSHFTGGKVLFSPFVEEGSPIAQCSPCALIRCLMSSETTTFQQRAVHIYSFDKACSSACCSPCHPCVQREGLTSGAELCQAQRNLIMFDLVQCILLLLHSWDKGCCFTEGLEFILVEFNHRKHTR